MATTRRIPADRGLTARMFLTGLLLVLLFVGLGAVLAALHFPIYWVIAIPAALLFFQYWFDDVQTYPKVAPRQGSLHWTRVYKVVPARSGWEMITPTPNPAALLGWMVEEQFGPALELLSHPLNDCTQGF